MATNIETQSVPGSLLPRESSPNGIDVFGVKSGRTVKTASDNFAFKSDLSNLIGGMLPQGEVANVSDLPLIPFDPETSPNGVRTGYAYIVTNSRHPESGLSYIYIAKVISNNGVNTVQWNNTGLTAFPSDVITPSRLTSTLGNSETEAPSEYAVSEALVNSSLIASEYFTRESTFNNIATRSIISLEAKTNWSGQYSEKLYLWYMNNGNNVSVRPSLYINRADSNGNIIATGAGIIAQYINDSFITKSGIEEIEIKEVNFSGVNFKITIDWGKLPYTPGTNSSLNSVLNSDFFLKKFETTNKPLSLKNSTSNVRNNEVFVVNKLGDYKPLIRVKFEDLTWTNGKSYNVGQGIINVATMSISNPIPVSPGDLINIPLIPASNYAHVFLDASDNIIEYFGNLGASWQVTNLTPKIAPANAAKVAFSWGTAVQFSQYFVAELPQTNSFKTRIWNDLTWIASKAWTPNATIPITYAGVSVSERIEVFSQWIEVTTVPLTSIGIACFDENNKLLGVIVTTTTNWGDKKKVRLFLNTKYVSASYSEDHKESFSLKEISEIDFSITEKGLYLVTAQNQSFKIELLSTDTSASYDYTENLPIIPPQVFLRSDRPVWLYKNSMLSTIKNSALFSTFLSSNMGTRKVIDIQEPTMIAFDDIDTQAKFVVQQYASPTKLIYKDVRVFKSIVEGLTGKTIKVMSLGDSLTEGLRWIDTPVCMLSDALKEVGVSLEFVGTLSRNFTNRQGETVKINYEGRGGWRYGTAVGLESQFAGINQLIPESQTKSEWMLGVDGATMNDIKRYNPFLYPASAQDLIDYPEWCFHFIVGNTVYNKSYAQDSTLGTYYIFDPARYFTLRNIEIPDILTIAFGTNEWYLDSYGGFDLNRAVTCLEFILRRFRQALPNTKIVVIPAQPLMLGRDETWRDKYSKLCSNAMKVVETKITAGDTKLFVCPIYAQGSRSLAFDQKIGAASNLTDYNSVQQINLSQDVHYLYSDDESNNDYKESLAACVLNLIND